MQGSAVYEWIDESQCSEKAGICTVKRKGEQPYTSTFTLEDAKRAGLLGKQGPWTQYTKRMLQLRARGFALRDKFADVLKGMIAAEEALDTVTVLPPETGPSQPESLKDKLRAQLEPPQTTESNPEDGAGDSPHVSVGNTQQASDAPAQSAAEFARQKAEEMPDDLSVDGIIGNYQPYEGAKAYQKGAKPGVFDVEDGQGGIVMHGLRYFDPAMDLSSGLKRIFYKTDSFKGRTQYHAVKIEALE